MEYGATIREFRIKAGLSQEQLGERVGVSRSAVYNWEKEKYAPTDAQNIAALEIALGLQGGTIYNLIYGNPTTPRQPGAESAAAEPVVAEG